jgi:hypothetical protein
MKKSVRKRGGGSIRPARSPVLAIRVPAPVHKAITKAAAKAKMTISDYVAQLIIRGQEFQEIIGVMRVKEQPDEMKAKEKPDEPAALDPRIADEIKRAVEAALDKRGVR